MNKNEIKKNKDIKNEYIGIISIIVIVIFAVLTLYYFFSERGYAPGNNDTVPIEAGPAPGNDKNGNS